MANHEKKTVLRQKESGVPYRAQESLVPPVDIYETREGVFIIADMPGIGKDNLEIKIDKNKLHLFGRMPVREWAEVEPRYSEIPEKDFYRAFIIGEEIDRGKITASITSGILKIILPKIEKMTPKRIEIKVQ